MSDPKGIVNIHDDVLADIAGYAALSQIGRAHV